MPSHAQSAACEAVCSQSVSGKRMFMHAIMRLYICTPLHPYTGAARSIVLIECVCVCVSVHILYYRSINYQSEGRDQHSYRCNSFSYTFANFYLLATKPRWGEGSVVLRYTELLRGCQQATRLGFDAPFSPLSLLLPFRASSGQRRGGVCSWRGVRADRRD